MYICLFSFDLLFFPCRLLPYPLGFSCLYFRYLAVLFQSSLSVFSFHAFCPQWFLNCFRRVNSEHIWPQLHFLELCQLSNRSFFRWVMILQEGNGTNAISLVMNTWSLYMTFLFDLLIETNSSCLRGGKWTQKLFKMRIFSRSD